MENNLGGDMPQDRLDRIRDAWMKANGKSRSEWDSFVPENTNLVWNTDYEEYREEGPELDNESGIHFEYPLCPTPDEISRRSRKTAQYYETHASDPNRGERSRKAFRIESLTYFRIAEKMQEVSEDMLRKGR